MVSRFSPLFVLAITVCCLSTDCLAVNVDLNSLVFLDATDSNNTLVAEVDAGLLGSDEQAATVSGMVTARMDVELGGPVPVVNRFLFTGGTIELSDVAFDLRGGLVVVETVNLAGTPGSELANGLVDDGLFNGRDHSVTVDRGQVTGLGAVLLDLQQDPAEFYGQELGEITLSRVGPAQNNAGVEYEVSVEVPIMVEDTWIVSDVPLIGTVNIDFTASANLIATDRVVLDIPVLRLQAGDANQDLSFDQLDIVKVITANKYLTNDMATWGEGDWDGAPGGEPGNPPPGNGRFDSIDIIHAVSHGLYLSGPYALMDTVHRAKDSVVTLRHDRRTGRLSVSAPEDAELTSIQIESQSRLFNGSQAGQLNGAFDISTESRLFKASLGSSFGDVDFGEIVARDIDTSELAADFTILGSFVNGELFDENRVAVVSVPEPTSLCFGGCAIYAILLGRKTLAAVLGCRRGRSSAYF